MSPVPPLPGSPIPGDPPTSPRHGAEAPREISGLDLGIAIVSFHSRALVLRCLASLDRWLGDIRWQAVVINNSPADGTTEAIRATHPHVLAEDSPGNVGFARASNRAMALLSPRPRHLLLLNPDTELRDPSLIELVGYLDRNPSVGIAGADLRFEDGRPQPAVRRFPSLTNILFSRRSPISRIFPNNPRSRAYIYADRNPEEPGSVDAVCGAALAIRQELYDRLGGLDETFFLYMEDTDLCFRAAQAGWETHLVPTAIVHHSWGGASRSRKRSTAIEHQRSLIEYLAKHRLIPAFAATILRMFVRLETLLMRIPHLMVATVCALVLSSCATSGINQGDMNFLSTRDEVAIGNKISSELAKELDLITDPVINSYVDRIGQALARVSDRKDLRYTFDVIDDANVINAFAIPGGGIYIYTGLLLAAESEAEVAGVLAHEVGHIAARHSAEQLSKQYGISLALELAAGEKASLWIDAASHIAEYGSSLLLLSFGRDAEIESDRLALRYTRAAGWNPRGLALFLEKLAHLERRDPSRLESMLATHPHSRDRLTVVQSELARTPPPSGLEISTATHQNIVRRLK